MHFRRGDPKGRGDLLEERNVKAYVVIGANYGDEGKGHIVDYLTCKHSVPTVVRFSGGAQAGHTVQTRKERHVFHTFGSGSFAGARTFLDREFIFNPILYLQEFYALRALNWMEDEPTIHPSCRITTISDMLLNQAAERKRGNGRHGSCGIGINETVTRCEDGYFDLRVGDLASMSTFAKKVQAIADGWVSRRAEQLGFTGADLFMYQPEARIIDQFLKDCDRAFNLIDISDRLLDAGDTVFEGAQGLALDEMAEGFPHVTRARTGLTNIVERLDNFDEVEVVYVTRPFFTRHGAGPLKNEVGRLMPDETNITNEWQGSFRFSIMDLQAMVERIAIDFAEILDHKNATRSLALTCYNKVADTIEVETSPGIIEEVRKFNLPHLIARKMFADKIYISEGKLAENVFEG
jgi:adenylosuccinate synthase